jgi:hypothetical protein
MPAHFPRKRQLSEVGLSRSPIPEKHVPWTAPTMSERLVNVDRETPMQLPANLRKWVPEDDRENDIGFGGGERLTTPPVNPYLDAISQTGS